MSETHGALLQTFAEGFAVAIGWGIMVATAAAWIWIGRELFGRYWRK